MRESSTAHGHSKSNQLASSRDRRINNRHRASRKQDVVGQSPGPDLPLRRPHGDRSADPSASTDKAHKANISALLAESLRAMIGAGADARRQFRPQAFA